MAGTIGAVICGAVALVCFFLGYRQLKEKGSLLNNAYTYSSEEERQKMNKKPYYKQSGIIFILIGIIFAVNAIEMKLRTGRLVYLAVIMGVLTVVYAIASSISIERNKKD